MRSKTDAIHVLEGCFGYLLEKNKIFFGGKQYEVCKIIDVVFGVYLQNMNDKHVLSVFAGDYQNSSFRVLDSIEQDYTHFVAGLQSIRSCLRYSNNQMNFSVIHDFMLECVPKYYFFDHGFLREITDSSLLSFLERKNLKDLYEKDNNLIHVKCFAKQNRTR